MGQQTLVLARAVNAPDGRLLGVVLAAIATTRFEKLFASVLPSAPAAIALFRRDGAMLSREPRTESGLERSPEVQGFLRETVARAEQGTLHTQWRDAAGARQLMAVHTVRGYPVIVAALESEEVVLEQWRRYARQRGALTLIAVVLVMLLLVASLRHLRLQGRMRDVAAARATEAALRRSEAALKEELEVRVRERTCYVPS